MDHLSSCYFCATALDRPLQTVRLAASDGADDPPALTLCPPCRRKLERVFEVTGVDESVGLAASGDGGAGDQTDAGEDGLQWGSPGGGAEDSSAEALAGETPDEILEEVSPQDGADEVDDGENAEAEAPDSDSADAEDSTGEPAETEDSTGEPAETEGTAGEAGEHDESDETADEPAAGDSDTTGDSAAGAEASSETGGDTSGTAASGGESSKRTIADDNGGSSMSALEYNKVIRLLQNREFPVNRDEIVTIAANAYDLRRAECAAILDLAVEREVLAESDGKLYRPE